MVSNMAPRGRSYATKNVQSFWRAKESWNCVFGIINGGGTAMACCSKFGGHFMIEQGVCKSFARSRTIALFHRIQNN